MSCRRQTAPPQNLLLSRPPIPPVDPSMVELPLGVGLKL